MLDRKRLSDVSRNATREQPVKRPKVNHIQLSRAQRRVRARKYHDSTLRDAGASEIPAEAASKQPAIRRTFVQPPIVY